MALTQEDLQAIGQMMSEKHTESIMRKVIQEELKPIREHLAHLENGLRESRQNERNHDIENRALQKSLHDLVKSLEGANED